MIIESQVNNPATAEVLLDFNGIMRKIQALPPATDQASRRTYREWLKALYRRGRVDKIRELGQDNTPGSHGKQDED